MTAEQFEAQAVWRHHLLPRLLAASKLWKAQTVVSRGTGGCMCSLLSDDSGDEDDWGQWGGQLHTLESGHTD